MQDQKNQLESLRDQLNGKSLALDNQKSQEQDLLTQTKNQETKYQQMVADTQKQQQNIEKEIYSLEEKLRLLINPNSLPGAMHGLFIYPVSGANHSGLRPDLPNWFCE